MKPGPSFSPALFGGFGRVGFSGLGFRTPGSGFRGGVVGCAGVGFCGDGVGVDKGAALVGHV